MKLKKSIIDAIDKEIDWWLRNINNDKNSAIHHGLHYLYYLSYCGVLTAEQAKEYILFYYNKEK